MKKKIKKKRQERRVKIGEKKEKNTFFSEASEDLPFPFSDLLPPDLESSPFDRLLLSLEFLLSTFGFSSFVVFSSSSATASSALASPFSSSRPSLSFSSSPSFFSPPVPSWESKIYKRVVDTFHCSLNPKLYHCSPHQQSGSLPIPPLCSPSHQLFPRPPLSPLSSCVSRPCNWWLR